MREEKKAARNRHRKKEAKRAGMVVVAPGVAVGILRRFRAALIGSTQGLPKQRRLPLGKPDYPKSTVLL